ncbi:hypothetical protein F5Y12DRAFT_714832 [Xylaria sp. FL1777]|nr:hypothetical protein F5Y12DRAFT_714832 [Xylaria sp. FL1777]
MSLVSDPNLAAREPGRDIVDAGIRVQARNGPRLIHIAAPITAVATVILFLRIFVRLRRGVRLGPDDWFSVLALLVIWGGFPIPILFVNIGGLGRPAAVNVAIDPSRLVIDTKARFSILFRRTGRSNSPSQLLFAGEFTYSTQILLIKLSILSLYRRVFPTRVVMIGSGILLGVTASWWLAVILVTIFQCHPVSKAIDPAIEGHCISQTEFFLGNAIPNIVTDVLILSLPLHDIIKLHLPRSQRVSIAGIFLLGGGVIVASSIRLYYCIQLARDGNSADVTRESIASSRSDEGLELMIMQLEVALVNPVLWTVLEPNLALICACLPTLRPLLVTITDSALVRSMSSHLVNSKNRLVGGSSGTRTSVKSTRFANAAKKTETLGSQKPLSTSSLKGDEGDDPDHRSFTRYPWPKGYAADRSTTIGRTRSVRSEEILLGTINVETTVSWSETCQSSTKNRSDLGNEDERR